MHIDNISDAHWQVSGSNGQFLCLDFFKVTTMTGHMALPFSRFFARTEAYTTNNSSRMSSPNWFLISGSIIALMILAMFFALLEQSRTTSPSESSWASQFD